MAPNADEVTAAEREPRSTIVFERFARSSSLVDSQLLTVRRQSQPPRMLPKVFLSKKKIYENLVVYNKTSAAY